MFAGSYVEWCGQLLACPAFLLICGAGGTKITFGVLLTFFPSEVFARLLCKKVFLAHVLLSVNSWHNQRAPRPGLKRVAVLCSVTRLASGSCKCVRLALGTKFGASASGSARSYAGDATDGKSISAVLAHPCHSEVYFDSKGGVVRVEKACWLWHVDMRRHLTGACTACSKVCVLREGGGWSVG